MNPLLFQHPFTAVIAGPTSSGKTVFVRRLLENYKELTTFDCAPLRVLYCYGQFQSGVENTIIDVAIKPVEGLADESLIESYKPHLVIIDDLMNELKSSSELSALFTKKSHHLRISVIFILQNLFCKGNEIRNISLNCHYIVAMKSPRDRQQLKVIGRQMGADDMPHFVESYDDATSQPYGYLLLDFTQTCPDALRKRTSIFPGDVIKGVVAPVTYQSKKHARVT